MPRRIEQSIALEAKRLAWGGRFTNKEIGKMLGICEASVSLFKHGRRQKSRLGKTPQSAIINNNPGEKWLPITNHPSYEVSNHGRIKRVVGGWSGSVERLLKPCKGQGGYLIVILHSDGRKRTRSVHRLVAEAHLPRVEGKLHVNHIDSNCRNNRLDNLEWCTPQENVLHSIKFGNRKRKKAA